jgi:hypothetical protein
VPLAKMVLYKFYMCKKGDFNILMDEGEDLGRQPPTLLPPRSVPAQSSLNVTDMIQLFIN